MANGKQLARDVAEATPRTTVKGKLSITQNFIQFNGKGIPPTEITRTEHEKADPRNCALELVFQVDETEFDPNRKWAYTRRVRVGSKTWRTIVLPSIIDAFGSLENFQDGEYVEAEDTPQVENPKFSVPKLLRKFASREDCARAWAAPYGRSQTSEGAPLPADILETARTLLTALGGNLQVFETVIRQDERLGQYAPKILEAMKL